jgi:C4-dicarboxylate-specific signal transduction histidine kinase
LELSLKTGNKNLIKDSYKSLADINARLNNYKEAYENEVLYKQANDSVFNNENENKLTQLQMQNDFDKKEAKAKAEQEKKDAISKKELQKQKVVRNGFMGGLGLVILLLFFVYRNYANQRATNKKLKEAEDQLIKSEKMAAFGMMASRVSHEIQNPLNFINSFSELSQNLAEEAVSANNEDVKKETARELIANLQRINHHGKRVDRIIKQLQEHIRTGTASEFFETA